MTNATKAISFILGLVILAISSVVVVSKIYDADKKIAAKVAQQMKSTVAQQKPTEFTGQVVNWIISIHSGAGEKLVYVVYVPELRGGGSR